MGRRNLSDEQKTYLIGKQYEAEKHCETFHGNQYVQNGGDDQNGHHQTGATRKRIATETGTSEGHVQRAGYFVQGLDAAEEASPGIREAILSGAATVKTVHPYPRIFGARFPCQAFNNRVVESP